MLPLIVFRINAVTYAECSYPWGKGDGIHALYISQLCQSTSSGPTLPSSHHLPSSIVLENTWLSWLVSNMCICVCINTFLQLPDSMKQSQADLYLETYQVLDLEMSRLREIQRWQASAASKVQGSLNLGFTLFLCCIRIDSSQYRGRFSLMQLAADMQRFSRPERRINGPTVTHLWFV